MSAAKSMTGSDEPVGSEERIFRWSAASYFECVRKPLIQVCAQESVSAKNLLQLIMESTSWCVVWFGSPNEDWIHPSSLTVRWAEYAALQPVSMEMLRSCSSPPTPQHCHRPPPPSAVRSTKQCCFIRGIWARVCMCACVGYNGVLTGRHTPVSGHWRIRLCYCGIIKLDGSGCASVCVCVCCSIVTVQCVCVSVCRTLSLSWCVMLVVAANPEALL